VNLPLEWHMLAVAAFMTLGAAFIRGMTGFGMAIILVPLLGMIMRPDHAVVLAILLQFIIGPVGLRTIIVDSHKASAFVIAGLAVVTTPLGLWLLAHTAPDVARIAIALIAVGAFALIIVTRNHVREPSRVTAVFVGISAGVLTGFAAMPGPPVIPYYLREAFAPRVARASMLLIFFATAIAGTLSAFFLGLVQTDLAVLSLMLFPAMFIGNALGARAFGKVSPLLWRSLVAVILGIAAVSAVWRALG
jgi:uncharacterized protein